MRISRTAVAALLAVLSMPVAWTQQTPNRAPLPGAEPLPADPVPPTAEEMTLLPDELLLVPQKPPPPERREKLPPFKLRLEPVEIEPMLPPLPPGFADSRTLSSALRVQVKGFRFKGNKIFSDKQLQKVVARFSNREVTSAELEEARQAVTLYYVERGFINSGAVLPDQDLKDGLIVLQVIEGRLTKIELEGNYWLRSWWLRHELRRSAGQPLNFNELKVGLQLLRQDPNLRQINAELMPGGQPGESILKVDVKENQPFRLGIDFSNRRPPSVGAEIFDVTASMLSLTGHSDPLVLRWGAAHATSETADHWEFGGLDNIEGSYRFPITPWHTTLEAHASKNDSAIVEETFAPLDITSKSEQFGATLRQPWHETLDTEFATSLTAERRRSESFLLDTPFSLSPGAIDGVTKVFVLRLALEFTNRSQKHVLALRSTFNFGIDAFDATRRVDQDTSGGAGFGNGGTAAGEGHRKIPDGRFFSWLGQAQYVRRLFNTDSLAVLRLNAQLATDPLLSLEQFSLGGAQSVRGYRENQLLRDNGVFASLEVRVPIWRNKEKNPILALAPFFDFGVGWDHVELLGKKPSKSAIDDRMETLASVGLGLLFTPSRRTTAQLYWGYALNQKNRVDTGNNLQDYGLHFVISFNAF